MKPTNPTNRHKGCACSSSSCQHGTQTDIHLPCFQAALSSSLESVQSSVSKEPPPPHLLKADQAHESLTQQSLLDVAGMGKGRVFCIIKLRAQSRKRENRARKRSSESRDNKID